MRQPSTLRREAMLAAQAKILGQAEQLRTAIIYLSGLTLGIIFGWLML